MALQDLYRLIEDQLSARTKTLRTLVTHRSSIGWVNEQALGGLLRSYLPRKCALGSGFVLMADERQSKQGDVLIYNADDYPPLFREEDLVVICPEALLGVIEVKTQETEEFLKQALDNIASYKELCPSVFGAVLFLNPPAGWDTAKQHLESLQAKNQRPADALLPEHIAYLGKWTAQWDPGESAWICQDTKDHTLLSLLNALLVRVAKTDVLKRYSVGIKSDLVATVSWKK